ncbi:hypothetical protein VSS76_13400 [Bacillus safensis]|uniref:hypothetical protein n=2 Tax=Bacillaceae TaxID=186817 RepID=UPI002DD42D2B|nr:hypothetical protein [Bacillus safensis]MEC4588269.1 hypothetical protein [Bacillus safensis]MEC4628964.1 hypothetical protein [Bacillus safensis]
MKKILVIGLIVAVAGYTALMGFILLFGAGDDEGGRVGIGWISLLMMILAIFLCACQSVQYSQSKPPSAEELLAMDQQADLFQWEGTVYETNVDWTTSLHVTKHQQVGVIQKTAVKNFEHGTASRLQKGTAIYSVKEREDMLVVELHGKTKIYTAHAEG